MRYIVTRQPHTCAVCKDIIEAGEVCIQSQGTHRHYYHDDCHRARFGNSIVHAPTMTKTAEEEIIREPNHPRHQRRSDYDIFLASARAFKSTLFNLLF